jgi:Tat protein translocase TatB subunit
VFNVGPLELIVVLIIALIVLGPQRLPEVARSVGRGMREFRSALEREHDDEDEEHREHELEPAEPEAAEPEATAPEAAEPATARPATPAAAAATAPPPSPAAPDATYQKDAESSEPSSSSSERV